MMAMFVTVVGMSASSCSKDDEEVKSPSIVGSWECVEEYGGESFKMILTFNSNSTGRIEEIYTTKAAYSYVMDFSWGTTSDASGNSILNISYISGDQDTELFPGSGSTALWTRQYVLTGDILNIYGGDGVWVFKRI